MNTSFPRVLVIDDNAEIHEDFRKILCVETAKDDEFAELESLFGNPVDQPHETRRVEIEFASQGAEGLEKVRQSLADGNPYSLAFIDIRMPPGWDGVKTTKKIWEIDPEIQVVICSAFSDYTWKHMACELEHSDRFLVLKKPFESIEVRQLVSALHQRWSGARSDTLTGLINRRAFLGHFQRQCEISRQESFPLSCAMIDLDFFKHINDTHGHPAGDRVLCAVAQLLTDHCRKGDHVARYGGEEFCVLFRDTTESAAAEWAEQTRQALNDLRVEIDDETTVQITASIGVAELSNSQRDTIEGIKYADMALLFAKQSGRNRVCGYSEIEKESPQDGTLYKHHAFHETTAQKIMGPVSTIDRDTSLGSAARMLVKENLSSAAVVDSEGQLVGILNDSDLLPCFVDDEQLRHTMSHQVMQTSLIYFSEETPLREIFDFLIRVSIPQVVVVRDRRPVGVIARATLLNWLCSMGYPVQETTPLSSVTPAFGTSIGN